LLLSLLRLPPPRPEDNAPTAKGNDAAITKPSDRNLFTAEDGQKVAAIGIAQRLDMPKFALAPVSDGPLSPNAKFVGIWSSKRGWNGKGRYSMVIVTEVSDTGLARGYYVWGPPVKGSWTQDAAGYKWFAEYIANDRLVLKTNPEIEAKLQENVLTLSTTRLGKPSDKSSIQLRPIWQLTRIPGPVRPTVKREQASPRERSGKEAASGSNPARTTGGTTMEDRYRACRKLVKGFARREACARTGAI